MDSGISVKSSLINKICYLLIFIYILLIFIYDSKIEMTYIYKIPMFILIIIQAVRILKTRNFLFPNNIKALFLLTSFSLVSSLWAINSDMSIANAKTLFLLTSFLLILYNFLYYEKDSLLKMLKILMFAGVVFSIYVILYYGFSNFFEMLNSGARIGEEIDNVNKLGLEAGISFLLTLFFSIYYNKKYLLLSPLPLLVALGSGSRKVMVLLIIGSFLLLLSKQNRSKVLTIVKNGIIVVVFLLIVSYLLENFSDISIVKRMAGFINGFTNTGGKVDSSTLARKLFINAGIHQFWQNPILGIGSANSGYITSSVSIWFTYLHNNYVELLATMGIIGFVLFYYNYAYLIVNLVKNKKCNKSFKNFVLILLFLLLIMDYGLVSYYSKNTYIYFLIAMLALGGDNNEQTD